MATVQKYVRIFYNSNRKNTIKCKHMRLKFHANIMTFTYYFKLQQPSFRFLLSMV